MMGSPEKVRGIFHFDGAIDEKKGPTEKGRPFTVNGGNDPPKWLVQQANGL